MWAEPFGWSAIRDRSRAAEWGRDAEGGMAGERLDIVAAEGVVHAIRSALSMPVVGDSARRRLLDDRRGREQPVCRVAPSRPRTYVDGGRVSVRMRCAPSALARRSMEHGKAYAVAAVCNVRPERRQRSRKIGILREAATHRLRGHVRCPATPPRKCGLRDQGAPHAPTVRPPTVQSGAFPAT